MIAKHRHVPGISGGDKNPNSVLTAFDVHQIRQRLSDGERQQAIADYFGVTQAAISAIATGKNWSVFR
jgi:transcriptional regulator